MNTLLTRGQWEPTGRTTAYWPLFVAALAGLYLASVYAVDVLASVPALSGLNWAYVHELFHDVRHAAGFMCH